MSARGWAGRLHHAADVLDKFFAAVHCERIAITPGELRELAALLDRITPEAVTVAEMQVGYPDLPPLPDLFAALRELARGPAEQQEGGR